ncbi:MAG: ADP,ATP carrier protein 1 [Chlamydiales bacterium]|nr:ADP,ATP carrier protein 1 [Chlamydiales bacterium]MCH9636199.1 ADP,ATP carrier protein 1 [Chlamydiales bacterium]MCH9703352.1 NTP/NDP exchange transporter [Chlamydiota bacterium]
MSEEKSFSKLRAYLWPIHLHELKKFLPLFFLAFFIGFNYNILRNMKDALLVTAESSGAEVLPFIKVWGIVPGALLMTFIYSRLNNRLTRDRVFYSMVSIFLIFFTLFTFVLYPIREHLHLHGAANYLAAHLPSGFGGLIAMVRYWTFSSFYIMSELWSSAILSMLFWGFANQVTKLGEAKRFYGLIAIGLNLAAINSGQVACFITGDYCRNHLVFANEAWHQSIILLTSVVLISGLAILAIYRYLTKRVLPVTDLQASKPPKVKMSMRENFAYLWRSKYLLRVAVIVLAYNVTINLIEVIWKDQVRQMYPDPCDFTAYMSHVTTITGVISFFLSLLVSGQVIRRFGWTIAALLTPIILLTTSVGFFASLFGGKTILGMISILGTTPLALAAFFGSAQNCLARASKFTLFDSTKEMAFIPLSMESKLKGKAAIDGVGSRLGKSGGSLVHQGLLMAFGTIAASAHIVAVIVFGVIIAWTAATFSLGRRFKTLTAPEPAQPTAQPEPEPATAQS